MSHSYSVKIIWGLKIRMLGCMFSIINFVLMPHEGWMKNDSSFTKNEWSCKPNPNSLPNTSQWLLSLLLVASYFSFFLWLLVFLATSLLRRCHLQHACIFPLPLLYSTRFSQCWNLCDLHVAPAIFAQLLSFLYFAIFLRDCCDVTFNPTSIFDRSQLSLIVKSQRLGGRFLHSLKVLLTYFLWHLHVS